jgi:hypothetical protein
MMLPSHLKRNSNVSSRLWQVVSHLLLLPPHRRHPANLVLLLLVRVAPSDKMPSPSHGLVGRRGLLNLGQPEVSPQGGHHLTRQSRLELNRIRWPRTVVVNHRHRLLWRTWKQTLSPEQE